MEDEDTSGQFEDGSEEQGENRMEDRSGAPGGPGISEDPESGQFVAGNGESGGDVSTGGYGGSQGSGGSQAAPYDSGFQVGSGDEAAAGAFAGGQGADTQQNSGFDAEGQSGFRNDLDAGAESLGATDQNPLAGDTGTGAFDVGGEAERTESGETGDRQRPDEEETEDEFDRGAD